MDTSETYIKMCEKAEEIQESKWSKRFPSHLVGTYWQTTKKQLIDLDGDFLAEIKDTDNISETRYVWLPRQDQLQDMITDRPMSGLLLDFRDSALAFLWGDGLDSMEQLWVAFVMKEKYNKVWNGEGWIEDIASASTGLDNSMSRRG